MKLIKAKGIVIKEVQYSENDKILTILTDRLGLITAMAKGAKKNNSPFLASCQYLVYSEFVLFKGTNFYHVNSTSVINTFYKLRVDFDKLTNIFEITKLINKFTEENMETSEILNLFLNTLHITMNEDKPFASALFVIRMFKLLGFAPDIFRCNVCGKEFKEAKETKEDIWYNYLNNYFICDKCSIGNKKTVMKVSFKTFMNIRYIMYGETKNIFALIMDERLVEEISKFSQHLTGCITSNL